MHARSSGACPLPDCACRRRDEDELRADTASERRDWRASKGFESWARRELAAEGVEFREWLVLEALSEMRDPSKDGF
ncbi:MAG TPA: hypothetical protein VHB79_26985 [Polyangiaceae bacterium]|nr:hypothetical protein [Polyangiaceae bacterium]